MVKKVVKKTVKKTVKKPAKKISRKCPKCKNTALDAGFIKIGPVYKSHAIGYRSNKHSPYADHVGQQEVIVCRKCGYAEIYFDTADLFRKLRHK